MYTLIYSKDQDLEYMFVDSEQILSEELVTLFMYNLDNDEYPYNILVLKDMSEVYKHTGSMWEYFTGQLSCESENPLIKNAFSIALEEHAKEQQKEALLRKEKYEEGQRKLYNELKLKFDTSK